MSKGHLVCFLALTETLASPFLESQAQPGHTSCNAAALKRDCTFRSLDSFSNSQPSTPAQEHQNPRLLLDIRISKAPKVMSMCSHG